MERLHGKVAIITGAAAGIGEATARLFSAEGARVILTDIQDEMGERVAQSIGESACFIHHDVSKSKDWRRVIAEAEARFGTVSVLVNNASIAQVGIPLYDCSEETYRRVIDVNQVSVFLGMNAVIPSMRQHGAGSIVNVSSVAGLVGIPGSIAYSAAKFAVTGMTKVAALDLGEFGIRVNSVHPGVIATSMLAQAEQGVQSAMNAFAQSLPIGRLGRAVEIAEVILFLASDASSFCTGAAFAADGGLTAA